MVKLILTLNLFVIFQTGFILAQNVNIPDVNFLNKLIELGLDANHDGQIQISEAVAVNRLDIQNAGIADLTGIEAFTNLDTLICTFNQLTTVDFSHNTKLLLLFCSINNLTELDVSANTALQYLSCSNNELTDLNLFANTDLKLLDCGFNNITGLDLTTNTNLEVLECYVNLLDSLDLSGNPHLLSLYCHNNNIKSLDLSENAELNLVDCQFNKISYLNLTNNIDLTYLACFSNQLTSLDVTKNTKLKHLDCGMNLYTSLNLSQNDSLVSADCSQNPNLEFICVKDTNEVNSSTGFYKDDHTKWTQSCIETTISEHLAKYTVKLYPNQGRQSFTLSMKQPAQINIYTFTGIEIERFDNVQNLHFGYGYRQGLYVVKIRFLSDNTTKVLKIIKE